MAVFPQRRDGAIVFEECLDRWLIETQDGFRLTPGGEAMVRGKAKPRAPLAKAQALRSAGCWRRFQAAQRTLAAETPEEGGSMAVSRAADRKTRWDPLAWAASEHPALSLNPGDRPCVAMKLLRKQAALHLLGVVGIDDKKIGTPPRLTPRAAWTGGALDSAGARRWARIREARDLPCRRHRAELASCAGRVAHARRQPIATDQTISRLPKNCPTSAQITRLANSSATAPLRPMR